MQHCFIMISVPFEPDTTAFLSLLLNEDGTLAAPLEERSVEALNALQQNADTTLILPAEYGSFYHFAMPRLNHQKAKNAIAFALEPVLPESLEKVHWAYRYDEKNHGYIVAVIEKTIFQSIYHTFHSHPLFFKAITFDADLLLLQEACILSSRLLIHHEAYQGMIPSAFTALYASYFPPLTCFIDTPLSAPIQHLQTESLSTPIAVWLATKALKQPFINLCGDACPPFLSQLNHLPYIKVAGYLLLAWVLSLFLAKGIVLHQRHVQLESLDNQILTVYQQLFPGTKRVDNPRFRITEQLKRSKKNAAAFWDLLALLGQSPFFSKGGALEAMQYQEKTLQATLYAKNFQEVEQLTKPLEAQDIDVKKTRVTQVGKRVEVKLSLKLRGKS